MYIGQDGHEHGMGMAWVSTRHRSIVVYPLPFLHFFLFSPLIFFCVLECAPPQKNCSCLPSPSFFFPLWGAILVPSYPSISFYSSLIFFFPLLIFSISLGRSYFVAGWLTLLRFLSSTYALAPSYDWILLFLLTSPLEVNTSLLPLPFSCLL